MARSRRTPAMFIGQMLFGAFHPQTSIEIEKVTDSERSRGICSFTCPLLVISSGGEERLRDAARLPCICPEVCPGLLPARYRAHSRQRENRVRSSSRSQAAGCRHG